MIKKVFISGSISIKTLPIDVKKSIDKIMDNNFLILIGDADGIDRMVQEYCVSKNYINVQVYSIFPIPRFLASQNFNKKHIHVKEEIKKERQRQQEKDKAMTQDSDYSLVVWDGKSKGSYANILRAIENNKKVKVYLKDQFLKSEKVLISEIDYIYRSNNGYIASEIVSLLKEDFCDFFQKTQDLNKFLIQKSIITKDNGVYMPTKDYEEFFFIDKYRGKVTGIRFKNEFIDWILDEVKRPIGVQATLF